jgi:hypothetical protein
LAVAALRASSLQADPAGVQAPRALPTQSWWSTERIARPRRRRADKGAAASKTRTAAQRPGRDSFVVPPAVIAVEAAAVGAGAADARHRGEHRDLDRLLAAAFEQPVLRADGPHRGQTADPR